MNVTDSRYAFRDPAAHGAAESAPAADLAGRECAHHCERGLFDAAELQAIVAAGDAARWRDAGAPPYSEPHTKYRRAQIQWLHTPQLPWLFERLATALTAINQEYFGFDLWGFYDPLQLSRYEAGSGQHDWHTDRGTWASGRPPRKLSMVLQLSDPQAYVGGDLELLAGREPIRADRTPGCLHVFPAFVVHRVSPVAAGVRHSLVGWVCGPRFR
jgi:PKHD-type hydroxylase